MQTDIIPRLTGNNKKHIDISQPDQRNFRLMINDASSDYSIKYATVDETLLNENYCDEKNYWQKDQPREYAKQMMEAILSERNEDEMIESVETKRGSILLPLCCPIRIRTLNDWTKTSCVTITPWDTVFNAAKLILFP